MSVLSNIFSSWSVWFDVGGALATLLLGAWGGMRYSNKRAEDTHRKEAEISPKFQQQQNVVNDCLVALRIRANADRVKIGQFHNGGKFLDGSPMKRFSVTHESCDIGVPFEGTHLQNIVVTILWDLISYVKQSNTKLWYTRDLPEGDRKLAFSEMDYFINTWRKTPSRQSFMGIDGNCTKFRQKLTNDLDDSKI